MKSFRIRNAAMSLAALCIVVVGTQAHAQGVDDSAPVFSTSTSSASLLGPSHYLSAINGGTNRFTNIRFEIHLDLAWYGAGGIGGRVEFPLARNGILDGVDDEIALSVGAEFFYFYYDSGNGFGAFGVTPILALQWNFFLSSNVSIFPELGVAFLFGNRYYWSTFIAPYLGLGFRFHFTDRNALLLRVSWPAGFQVGITF